MSDVKVLSIDTNFICIDKDFDIKINSDDTRDQKTVATQLKCAFEQLADESTRHDFRFVHRLDHATSGALCVALNGKAAAIAQKAFCERRVIKHYLALVRGHVKSVEDADYRDIEIAIGKDASVVDFNKMCTSDNTNCHKPRHAKTRLFVLEHGYYNSEPASKLLLVPHTGRSHQLRVHCAYIGHLIVGDYTYSNRSDTTPYRMMLHSHRLIIPLSGQGHINVTAPDPFNTDSDKKWTPTTILSTYQQCVDKYELLKCSSAAS